MPSGLKRFQKAEALHFITFSCFHRLPLLDDVGARESVESVLGNRGTCYLFPIEMPSSVHG